ncbi:MAG: TadE family type IV pilus minor pilin [Nocardioides sp.]
MTARGGGRGERGAATVELAIAIPVLLAVTLGLIWLLSVALAQIQIVDAARETARAVARGDAIDLAVARGERVAPSGSTLTVTDSGGDVVVTARGSVSGPGGLFDFLPPATLKARAVAAQESP